MDAGIVMEFYIYKMEILDNDPQFTEVSMEDEPGEQQIKLHILTDEASNLKFGSRLILSVDNGK